MFVKIIFVLLVVGVCWSEPLSSGNVGEFISEIHNRWKTAGVTFLTTTKRLKYLHPFFAGSIRYLSKSRIPSYVISFSGLNEKTQHYHRHSGRLLIVVIIRTEHEISQFGKSTKKIYMDSPIWMMIFANIGTNRRICEFCQNPTGNTFQLKNGSKFFVFCCNNTKIEAWWSRDGESLEILPVGEIVNEKLQWLQNESLLHRSRHISQLQLRASFIPKLSSFRNSNGTYTGLAGETLTSLMHFMNFSIAPPIPVKSVGLFNKSKLEWTGAMGMLQRGEVDLIVNSMMMTKERFDYVHASVPILSTRSCLFIKEPEFTGDVQWLSYFQTFHAGVWMTIAAILFLSTALLTLIKYNPQRNRLWSVISESFHQLFGIFCQQGLHEFPEQSSLRITYFSIFLTALVVLASYSANIISVLTVPPSRLPFTSLEEFSNQVNYKMIAIRESAHFSVFSNSEEPLGKKIFKLMKPSEELPLNPSEAIQQICNEKVAYYDSYLLWHGIKAPCKIVGIGNHLNFHHGFMMRRGSPYIEIMNTHVIKLYNNGMLKHIKRKYYGLKDISPETEHGVEIWSIYPILLILCGGILLSFLVLSSEITFYRFTRKHSSKSN